MKKVIGLLIGTIIVLCFMACSPNAVKREVGFEDEEEVIEHFVERLNNGDIDGALKVCAYNLMAENFDYKKLSKMINVLPNLNVQSSSEYEMGIEVNTMRNELAIRNSINIMVFQFNTQCEMIDVMNQNRLRYDAVDFDDFNEYFNPDVLEEISLHEITTPEEAYKDNFEDRMKEFAEIYGGYDRTIRTVIYEYDDDYYEAEMVLIQYDDLWYIERIGQGNIIYLLGD